MLTLEIAAGVVLGLCLWNTVPDLIGLVCNHFFVQYMNRKLNREVATRHLSTKK